MNRGDAPGAGDVLDVPYESLDDLAVAYSRHIKNGQLVVPGPLPQATVRVQLHLMGKPLGRSCIAKVEGDASGDSVTLQLLDGAELARWVARCLATSASRMTPVDSAAPQAKILVVDDDDSHRTAIAEVLSEQGYDLLYAKDGADALGKAVEARPDLVLTDVNMPVMDGWQLLRLIRARATLNRTGVILLTTLKSDEERLKGYQLGVDDYVAKPVQGQELCLRVDKVLRERALRLSRLPPAAPPSELRGDLTKVALASVLGLLELERRSGVLVVEREGAKASMHVRDGAVIRLELSPEPDVDEPLHRFFHVLDWTDGSFELRGGDVDGADEVGMKSSVILIEHARHHDETGGGSG